MYLLWFLCFKKIMISIIIIISWGWAPLTCTHRLNEHVVLDRLVPHKSSFKEAFWKRNEKKKKVSFYIYGKKQSMCESHRNTERGILGGEGADMRVVFTSVLMGPLLCVLSVGATRISGSTRRRRVGESGWTMFTRPLHSFSCATPGLFCSPEAAVKPIKKWQVRPQWGNNTNPLPPHQLLCTPKPLATKTRAGGEWSEGEKRRSAKEEECTLQWLPHSSTVALRCMNAAKCFQFHSTLSPRCVRINRTNERRKVTGCERHPERGRKETTAQRGQNWNEHFENVPRGKSSRSKFALSELRRLNGVLNDVFFRYNFRYFS